MAVLPWRVPPGVAVAALPEVPHRDWAFDMKADVCKCDPEPEELLTTGPPTCPKCRKPFICGDVTTGPDGAQYRCELDPGHVGFHQRRGHKHFWGTVRCEP